MLGGIALEPLNQQAPPLSWSPPMPPPSSYTLRFVLPPSMLTQLNLPHIPILLHKLALFHQLQPVGQCLLPTHPPPRMLLLRGHLLSGDDATRRVYHKEYDDTTDCGLRAAGAGVAINTTTATGSSRRRRGSRSGAFATATSRCRGRV